MTILPPIKKKNSKILDLFMGAAALGYVGFKLKKSYDKAKEENAYWTDEPKDIIATMISEKGDSLMEKLEDFEFKTYKFFDKVDKYFGFDKTDPKTEAKFKEELAKALEELRKSSGEGKKDA